METAFIQIMEKFVFVLIALQMEAKSVVQMAEPTTIRVNLRSMPTPQFARKKLARHMQTAFIQTVVLFVFVLIALQKEAKSVVQMAERTNTRVNLRSMPARKTRAFQSFHRVDVKVCWKQFMSIILVSSFLFLKGIPTLSPNRLSLGPRRR